MKKSRKVLAVLLALCTMLALFSGCGGSKEGASTTADKPASGSEKPTASGEKLYLNIGTGPSTGMYYSYGTAMGELWNKYIDNLAVTAQSTNAGAHNISLMDSGDVDIAFCVSGIVNYAVNGTNSFEGSPHPNLRAGAYFMDSIVQFVVSKDSGIESVSDLAGKRFIPGANNSGCEIAVREIFDALGMSYDDMTVEFVNFDGAVERISNGQADAAAIFSSAPVSSVMQLCSTANCKIISLTQEELDTIIAKYPWYAAKCIPAGTYDNQPEDVWCVNQTNWICYDESLDENLVYQMTKLLYENTDELIEMCSAAKALSKESTIAVLDTLPCEFHPGAARYFKEIGVIE